MKAAVYRRYGGIEEIETATLPRPRAGAREVVVRVRASSVNPIDWKIRRGDLRILSGKRFPRIPGADLSGEVAETGSEVTEFAVGDEVFAMVNPLEGGCFAEYRAVPAELLVRKPVRLTHSEAAAVPLAALTADRVISLTPEVGSRSRPVLLVNGASGGVGGFAVQLGVIKNTQVVGVCSARNAEYVQQLGATRVVAHDREPVPEIDTAYELVFDAVGNLRYRRIRRHLTTSGVFVSILPEPRQWLERVTALWHRQRAMRVVVVKPDRAALEGLAALLESGRLTVSIDREFSIEEAHEAHRYSETGRARGKIVVTI